MLHMLAKITSVAAGLLRWVGQRPGYLLFVAADEELSLQRPERFERAWLETMLLSLIWGWAAVQIWSLTWSVFGDYSGIPLMPVASVLAVMVLWPYRRAVLALAEAICPTESHRPLAVGVILAGMVLMWLGIKSWNPDFPTYLPPAWQWLRPRTMFRSLMLAPLWGGWSMLVACLFCKPSATTPPAVSAYARGCSPPAAAAVLAVVLAATIVYFNHLPWRQLSISVVAMVAGAASGPVICRQRGGLDRNVLLGANLLPQLAFMLAYLANR